MREIERVTPLELFFDLVFVFAITEVTTFLHGDPTWHGLGRALLLLGVLSLLAGELEASEPAKVAHPVVVIRRVYETRVVTTVRGGSGSGTGTSVSQSSSNSGPVSAAPVASTRSS